MNPKDLDIPDASDAVDAVLENVPEVARIVKGFAVPSGMLRVKVIDEKGKVRWRPVNGGVKATDTMDLKPNGQPQWMGNPIGRPKNAQTLHEALPPTSPVIADLIRIKEASLRTDPIVLTAETTPESADVLNQVVLGIAEEAASLRFERMEAERNGEDSSTFSMRRVAALKAIGDTWIKRKEQIQNQAVDMESPAFSILFKYIGETFAKAMIDAGVRQELADNVFTKFANSLDEEWKTEAKSRMTKE